jgi:SAM-dependent methyltransferase
MTSSLRNNNFRDLYDDLYFKERNFVDKKRIKSFNQERDFLFKHIKDGLICDVGCSTGEFLSSINWPGERYGMEINKGAIKVAKDNGIRFSKDILNQDNFFDVVVFRGTIQHLPNPFSYIQNTYESLKPGGFIVFLATPNMSSIFYKFFNDLPMLDDKLNFYIPSDKTLSNVLVNLNFNIIEIDKPYIKSPYANFISDHYKFIKKLLFRTDDVFAFWGSSMNMIAQKPL